MQKYVGSLQIDEDLSYQRREWRIQRIAWMVMAAMIAAGLAGFLGDGPASRRVANAPNQAYSLSYNRFVHHGNRTTLEFSISPLKTDEARLEMNSEYLASIEITRITPEPALSEVGFDFHSFIFKVAEPDKPLNVHFYFEPQAYGSVTGKIRLNKGENLEFDQFIYP